MEKRRRAIKEGSETSGSAKSGTDQHKGEFEGVEGVGGAVGALELHVGNRERLEHHLPRGTREGQAARRGGESND
jgi:hypothetical protein